MADWSDEDEDSKEKDVDEDEEEMMEKKGANLLFMALEDNEVTLKTFNDDDLQENFDELLENFKTNSKA